MHRTSYTPTVTSIMHIPHHVTQTGSGLSPTSEGFVFRHPFTAILAGPSGSGKTTLLTAILQRKDQLIVPPPAAIIWWYKRWQPMYQELLDTVRGIEFREGLPPPPTYSKEPIVYVLDDLMTSASESDTICSLFIEGSHHLNISVFYLMQNAFFKSKHNRSMQINTSYLILFKNPRNNIQPAILARDMFPTNWKSFMKIYQEATSKPYGYLLIDFKQETPDSRRVVTDIIPTKKKISVSQPGGVGDMSGSNPIPWISRTYKGILSLLSELPLRQIRALSSYFTPSQVSALRQLFSNILDGSVKLTPEQKKQLAPHKEFIRRFAYTSMKRCNSNKNCKAILLALQAAKSAIEQL